MGRGCAVVLLMLLAASLGARGEEVAQPVPADGKCSVQADKDWKPQEKFAWERVCVGEVVDFNEGTRYGGDLDPKRKEGLPENRILRSSFLETILLKDKYRRALTRLGVRISGARFRERIDLENAELGHQLSLHRSLLEQGANLSGLRSTQRITLDGSKVTGGLDLRIAHVASQLSLSGSKVTGKLDMNGLQVDEGLFMSEKAEFAEVDFGSARVGGTLDLSGSKVTGKLIMDKLQVAGSLFMRDDAEFVEVNLNSARVGGVLDLSGSKVTGKLDMSGLRVDQDLFMHGGAEFAEVNLVGAHVGGQLALIGSKVTGKLNMSALQVGETVFLGRDAEFTGPIDLIFSKVGGNLELAGGIFHEDVDITGAQVAGELRLGSSQHPSAQWPGNSALILRNAKADAIQDLKNAWPARLDLNGFTYRSLGGILAAEADPMAERPVGWFEGWLGKQDHYTPQPYEQLASVLRAQGQPDKADDILYAGRERERADTLKRWRDDHQTSDLLRWLWLTALDLLIGYGYHIERAIYWVLGLWVAGVVMLFVTGEGRRNKMPFGFSYSLDMLLPIIRLEEEHYRITLHGVSRYYFYGHKIMGYVLAAFLAAGLSGLTK